MSSTKKNTGRTASTARDGFPALLKHAAIGAAVAIGIAAALCFLGAALCLLSDDPAALTLPLGLIALYLASALGGVTAARLHKGAPLPCGLLCGGLLCVFFWFLTLFLGNADHTFSLPLSLLLRALTVGASALGSLVRLPKKRTYRRKRRA